MKIVLNGLKIKNFKGIKDFILNTNGQNILVFADNGKGKTTLMDAFLWALFDKDSTDRTNFKVKPQDEDGNDIHNLNTEVEVELTIDERLVKIKKMQEEKWTKKRGSETSELTGNTVSYWWDEVPVKAGEFKAKVSQLVDEDLFKMVTNPLYFNTKKSWQDRRKTLLEICGDMTDEQVIEADKSLLKLKEILKGRSIEDYKKVLADKLKGFKKEHDDIPPRIDELTHSLPQETIDYSEVENQLEEQKKAMQGIEFIMTSHAKKAEDISKKYADLGRLKDDLNSVTKRIDVQSNKSRTEFLEKKSKLEYGKHTINSNIELLSLNVNMYKSEIERNAKAREKLIYEWKEYSETRAAQVAKQFIEPTEDNFVCPTCGQDLPTEAKESKLQEIRNNFEKEKSRGVSWAENKLNENKVAGLKLKEETDKATKRLEEDQAEIIVKEEALKDIDTLLSKIEEELKRPVTEPNYSADAEYSIIANKIRLLQIEIDKPAEDKTALTLERKMKIQSEIDNCNSILNNRVNTEKKKARIEELKAEEKRISNLIAELEGHKFLLEKFTVSKVNLLEGKINSQFKFVKFKLFDVQVNGGIAETCEAMVNTNGCYVPFVDANSAGRINAGIDCINALGTFYGVTAPIWIDNRESVVRLIDTESQIISLIVSEKDKILRVKSEEK